MAYGIYYREFGDRTYKRATEFYKPERPIKFYATTDNGERMGIRDVRCANIEEANAVALRYAERGYETKIKEVK